MILLSLEVDLALLRLVEAADAVQKSGLAGAVRPDDGQDLISPDIQTDVRKRIDTAEAQRDIVNPDDGALLALGQALFSRDRHRSPLCSSAKYAAPQT